MKILIYIFLIYLSYVLCDFIDDNAKKVVVKKFPKKVKPALIQINNQGKYIKQKTTTKNHKDEKDYTAFPKIHNERVNIPDSPYFEEDKNIDLKTRIKKTLPSRSKRSAVSKKDEPTKKPLTSKPTAKPVGKNKDAPKGKIPNKAGKKINKNIKRKRRAGKRQGNRLRNGRLRSGPNRNRNLKYTRNNIRNRKNAKLRTRSGDKQQKQVKNNQKEKKPLDTKAKKVGRRLIAARDAMIEDYPYVVSLQKGKEHWCAGALLNPRLVITTANCLWKGNRMSRMSVRAGSRHTDRGGQVAYIREVMKHPGWKIRKTPDNDIALVLLDRNLQFSHALHAVDLPNRVMMPAFEDAWVTSWGTERRDGVFDLKKSDTLQVYHARVLSRQKCNNVTSRFGVTVTDNFICLAQTGRRAPCTRDTGAPAVSDGVLWGLASWGIRKLCGTERFPAMFSYLAAQTNLDFIINATHYLMSDEVHYPFLDRIPPRRANPTSRHIQN